LQAIFGLGTTLDLTPQRRRPETHLALGLDAAKRNSDGRRYGASGKFSARAFLKQ
jgi:hypothetical protein